MSRADEQAGGHPRTEPFSGAEDVAEGVRGGLTELDADHEPEAADITDKLIALRQRDQRLALAEMPALRRMGRRVPPAEGTADA